MRPYASMCYGEAGWECEQECEDGDWVCAIFFTCERGTSRCVVGAEGNRRQAEARLRWAGLCHKAKRRWRTLKSACALLRVAVVARRVGYVERLIEAKIEFRFGRDAKRFDL